MAEDIGKRIDDLHRETFNSSRLANDTELWNSVHEFKEKIKALVAPRAEVEPAHDKEI